ncbi:AAA family ATPase [uncultured Pseudacidovorax sp.]|uniref:AAA family ATPase n=1 Tax=uncultured Pseudacidovorax sp. TaxID=679313 RepID=UPI0025FA1BBA|nr:AAA family ATPase [uncultured Pseudacidovorax sp.]
MTATNYGTATETAIANVVAACERYGARSIVALAGVPGTGKSFVASIAAQRFCGEPLLVREIQFHQSFSYEEFIEGLRVDDRSAVNAVPGVFLEWNERALDDPERRYVLLIEEFTRANLAGVLGELMTYLEHRDRPFVSVYSRRPIYIAKNLTILATYNPTDRTAIELDSALIRRLRVVRFMPSGDQLGEMLGDKLLPHVIDKLGAIFKSCAERFGRDYEYLMPFGHGVFADVQAEGPDLHLLWKERIEHLLRRPLVEPHPFTDAIEELFPWRNPAYVVPAPPLPAAAVPAPSVPAGAAIAPSAPAADAPLPPAPAADGAEAPVQAADGQ